MSGGFAGALWLSWGIPLIWKYFHPINLIIFFFIAFCNICFWNLVLPWLNPCFLLPVKHSQCLQHRPKAWSIHCHAEHLERCSYFCEAKNFYLPSRSCSKHAFKPFRCLIANIWHWNLCRTEICSSMKLAAMWVSCLAEQSDTAPEFASWRSSVKLLQVVSSELADLNFHSPVPANIHFLPVFSCFGAIV